MSDYIIVADGNFLVREIIHEAIKDKTILALDAAADKLARIGITPHLLLGDFDVDNKMHVDYWGVRQTFVELTHDAMPYIGNHGVLIVPCKNQNLSDLIKAIHYCDKQNARSITIICALGGRMDHHEAAMRSLRAEYKKDRPLFIHTEQQTLRYAKDEEIIIKGKIGDKCGIFAFPKGIFSSQGLTYDVNNFDLSMGFSESIANSLHSECATITVRGEALLIMPPYLRSQREFMKKSEIERLEMLLRDARTLI
ncbi:MAG: thiamine diphosphokinase [Gammaproteobacteria bacterium]|nr:thiamine diphosphokinase [Gammaproteobacteria bacterium]MCW5582996.1 thiamine diphosphokinase [Gammaproteobacteria bacterium]